MQSEMPIANIIGTIFVFCAVFNGRTGDGKTSSSAAAAAAVPSTVDNLTTLRVPSYNTDHDTGAGNSNGGDSNNDADAESDTDTDTDASDSEAFSSASTLSSDSVSVSSDSVSVSDSTSADTTDSDEYVMFSASTVPRDRMGPFLNSHSHYLAHKDKPKSTEEVRILISG